MLPKFLTRKGRKKTDVHSKAPKEVTYMDIKEFREGGFLQEANRLFFHPLGLALEVVVNDDGNESLGGIWDYRDDPEGVAFGVGVIDSAKKYNVEKEAYRHSEARLKLFRLPRKKFMEAFVVQDLSYGARIYKHGGIAKSQDPDEVYYEREPGVDETWG